MSSAYENQDPLEIARQAEKDLNSSAAKTGSGSKSDSTTESGIDTAATNKFPGSTATYGSAASGAGDNREIPVEEGGSINPTTGQPTKARDFEGAGDLSDKARLDLENRGGDNDVQGNVRQGGETRRP